MTPVMVQPQRRIVTNTSSCCNRSVWDMPCLSPPPQEAGHSSLLCQRCARLWETPVDKPSPVPSLKELRAQPWGPI